MESEDVVTTAQKQKLSRREEDGSTQSSQIAERYIKVQATAILLLLRNCLKVLVLYQIFLL